MAPVLSVAVYKATIWKRLFKLLAKISKMYMGVLTRLPGKKHQTSAVIFWIEIIVYTVAQFLHPLLTGSLKFFRLIGLYTKNFGATPQNLIFQNVEQFDILKKCIYLLL